MASASQELGLRKKNLVNGKTYSFKAENNPATLHIGAEHNMRCYVIEGVNSVGLPIRLLYPYNLGIEFFSERVKNILDGRG